ncbi:MAG: carbon-nitrogen hydrolase family protein [Clostridiales bacterium]|jgi:N-carbamoylputrescine amidase|nr:carbon-nitrogen hydrolase family protein [Clostridiales bacterium]
MQIALATYKFKNKNINFSLRQIARALKETSGKADLLCFGEAFLQGFDSLCWDFKEDKRIAITQNAEIMNTICSLSHKYGVDLIFGYIEREDDSLYSSCAVVINGRLAYNYRRISRGWKNFRRTDEHYREGNSIVEFNYKGYPVMLAICGDLWDYQEKFKTDGILIWPVFVNYNREEWELVEKEAYAKQAALSAERTLMIGSLSPETEPDCAGGTFYFRSGEVIKSAEYGVESILFVEIE